MVWFNRAYLLIALTFSALLPLVHFTLIKEASGSNMLPEIQVYGGYMMLDSIRIIGLETNRWLLQWITQLPWLQMIYIVGFAVLIAKLLISLVRIFLFHHKASIQKQDGYVLIDFGYNMKPFSFFKFIFMNREHYDNDEFELIVNHELSHVRLKHSYDILFLELVLIVQWFNPFVWFIRYDLKEIHEYQADEETLTAGANLAHYKQLLVCQAVGTRFDFAHNFSQSLTKKRLKMMNLKIKQSPGFLKPLAAVALMTILTLVFGYDLMQAQTDTAKDQPQELAMNVVKPQPNFNPTVINESNPQEEKVYEQVDVMPEFPDGKEALLSYIEENIKYPVECIKNSIAGKVYIQFIIGKDGHVKNAKLARSVDPLLDAEALRVVNSMPFWKPGLNNNEKVNVSYTIPINFKLPNFVIVEEMPQFPGGDEEMRNFISTNTIYPEIAKKNGIQGRVYVKYVINTKGKVTDAKVIRGVHKELDTEALRVINSMPDWKPGMQIGVAVNVEFTVPVNFVLK